ncbi:MAG: hypothetical protein EBT86_07350 [Actinobacteria bacterium]|nr:hypothetical protein [Actinomycetota bacterium]
MAESLKILGQSVPTTTGSASDLYQVPADTMATISSMTVCNLTSLVTTFRISVSKGGELLTNKQYIFYDQELAGKSTFVITIGLTLSEGDRIRVQPAVANSLSFNVFGIEVA